MFEFGCGITALVGPNGSGKSNVVDALRWVFGEQNPRLLRGSRWEDVVFAGSNTRRPLGMAEVSVTLDNTEGVLPVPFREIEITRRLTRAGDAEYAINRIPSRLKDIMDLLSGTGAGAAAYAYMPQAAVDEILKSRPEDRRDVLEEAAGLARYRVRRQEAERRLAEVDAARQRVRDLIAELEGQLAPLRKEAETASRFISLRTEREDIAAVVWADSMYRLEKRLAAAVERHGEFTQRRDDATKTLRGLEEENATLESALGKTRRLRGEAEVRARALLAEENRRRAAAAVLKERLTSRRNELAAAARQLDAIQARQTELQRELEGLRSASEPTGNLIGNPAGISPLIKLRELESSVRASEAELSAALDCQSTLRLREAGLRERAAAAKTNLAMLSERVKAARRHLEARSGRVEAARRELEECRRMLARLRAEQAAFGREAAAAAESVETARGRMVSAEEQLREAREAFAAQQASLARIDGELLVAEESLVAVEAAQGRLPLAAAAKELAAAAEGRALSRLALPLSDLLAVQAGAERAVAAALGVAQHALLVDDWNAVKGLIRFRNEQRLPVGGVLAAARMERRAEHAPLPSGLSALRPLAATRDAAVLPEEALDSLLGGFAITEDLEGAVAAVAGHPGLRGAVASDGTAVLAGGILVAADSQSSSDNLILLKRERERLAGRALELRGQAAAAKQAYTGLQERIRALESAVREATGALRAAEKSKEAAAKRASDVANSEARSAARAEALEREIAAMADEAASLTLSLSVAEQEASEAERQHTATAADHASVAGQLNSAEEAAAAAAQSVQGLRVQLTRMQEAVKAEAERRSRLEGELQRLAGESATAQEAKQHAAGEALLLERESASAETSLEKCREERQASEADVRQLQAQVNAQEHTARNYRAQADKLGATRSDLERRLHRLEIARERMVGELRSLQVEKRALPPRHAAIQPGPDPQAAALRARSEEIEALLLAMGSVDLSAAEQCRRMSERHAFLAEQEQDLTASEGSLQASALEIEREIESRFMRSFEETRRQFAEVFTGLFGGGKADLELTDPEHPLTSGVEIMAQPPGKRMTSLALLSGGERALTAIALLFALLGRSKTGFCVLDEVDAYLDEPNCLRFRRYLRSLAGDRQFLVVTHNKGTMEAADVLYGMTMEEDGVSRVVSVRLDEPAANGRAG